MSQHEGGSDHQSLNNRLSASGEHVYNKRPSYRSAPSKGKLGEPPKRGCCGFGAVIPEPDHCDVVLVGGGAMSATLGLLFKQLEPSWNIRIYERLGAVAQESSNGWNNAGTGHSALCEPNYTPDEGDTVNTVKAITVNENWWLSRQYWSYLCETKQITNPNKFINITPHMTFAHGEDQIEWLKKRYNALTNHPLFKGMEYSDKPDKMTEWAPLVMEGRDPNDKVAMTRCDWGTDVDFGVLTEELAKAFMKDGGNLLLFHTVTALKKIKDDSAGYNWLLTVKKNDCNTGATQVKTKFVFAGAGGWALPLLQKSGIPEIKGFMGFPISGEFMVCQKPEIAERHPNKLYGKASIGAPPMSVPHLDARIIGGKKMLLFGPFAGFSPRYLKTGSLMDLICSVRLHNLIPAACAGLQNLDLTIYLAKQLAASNHKKFHELTVFIPNANPQDWTIVTAGQRVQIMKKDKQKCGILQFGTEVVAAEDGSICGLLGASPGASTAVQVALDVLRKTHPKKIDEWTPRLKKMIPSYGTKLADNASLAAQLKAKTAEHLNIK